MDSDHRMDQMEQIAAEEMSIEDYKVEPATTQCMTDFATLNDMGPDDIESQVAGDVEHGVAPEELPLNYYDNDDGFWDEYIKHK